MKRGKAIGFAKVIFSLFAAALFFASCSNFEEPVVDFLKNYGEIAKVMSVSYSRGYYSSPGWSNVDSSGDFTLRYYIYNPGNFPLAANLSVSGVADLAAAGITVSVDSNTSISVTYPASYLATVDMDAGGTGDISPSIFLLRATDFYGQSYDTRAIRCNAPPPYIQNALSQCLNDAATGDNERLVVCFDLPDLPSDVTLLNVTDRRTGTVRSFSISGGVITTAQAGGWTIGTVPPGTLEETCDGGPIFSHYEGTAYYITTDVQNLKTIDIFEIGLTLCDRGGLTTTRTVESRVQMLDPPTCNISAYATLENTYDQPYVEMIVTAPTKAPDAQLNFSITDENGDLVADVNGNTNYCQGSTTFRLYPKADGTAAQYYVGGIYASKQGWWGSYLYLGTIEVVGKKLEDPTADPDPASAATFPQDTEVTFTSPQNGNLLWVGPGGVSPVSAPSPLKVTLENPGLNEFAVYAEKDYYQYSGTATFTYNVTLSKVYVKDGASASGTGTLADPVGSINDAITILNTTGDPTSPGNKICILGDLPGINGLTSVSASYFNIIGCDADGNEGVVSSLARVGGGTIIQVNGAGVVSLRAISITGLDNASSGAVNVLDGGTLILKDKVTITGNTDAGGNAKNVNLAVGQVITVDAGGLAGTKVGITTATAPTALTSIPITSGYGASASKNDPPAQHFASDLASCGAIFNSAKTEAVLATGGGGIDIGEIYSVTFSAAVAGGKATITAKASTSSSPTPVDITDDVDAWSVKLFYLNTYTGVSSSGTTAAGGNVLGLTGLGAGTYIAKASATYGGKTYSGEVEVAVAGPTVGMVLIPAGSFRRAKDAAAATSGQVYTITLTKDFYMCDHEVTQKEWAAVMGNTQADLIAAVSDGEDKGSGDDYPVYYVNWYHAIAYCNKLSLAEGKTPCYSVTGVDFAALTFDQIPTSGDATWDSASCNWGANGYRLPTEAEWEYAALGDYKDNANWDGYGDASDASATVFAGYDGSNNIDDYAWYSVTATDSKTHEVKKKNPNSYGLYDMSGNVAEWCWDWYGSGQYAADGNASDPRGALPGIERVGRGGFYYNHFSGCKVGYRLNSDRIRRMYDYGFRVVRNAP